jgi:hypothetical protein
MRDGGLRHVCEVVLAGAFAFMFTNPASAQGGAAGAIAGIVKDTTGAVMPGVTVEASSPALIERVRTAVTDAQGEYKIIDLRPGTYSVSFTLPGFATVKREGIELTAAFSASVNAEMRVGTLEETVTVSTQSPIVDVQNVVQARSFTAEAIDALPTGRDFLDIGQLVPGVSRTDITDVGGTAGERVATLSIHGSHSSDMPVIYDGMRYNNMNGVGGGGSSIFMINTGNVQEMSVEVAGTDARHAISGVFLNVIPKDGGNQFRGYFFTNYTSHGLESDNWTGNSTLRSRNVGAVHGGDPVNTMNKVWDVNPAFGGPIIRDKLWFYTAYRYWGNQINVANMWENSTQNSPFYTPDYNRPATTGDKFDGSQNLRLTWQPSLKNKITGYYDIQQRGYDNRNVSATVAPEAGEFFRNPTNYLVIGGWTYTASQHLLIQARTSAAIGTFNNRHSPEESANTIAIQELSTGLQYAGMSNRAPNNDTSRAFNHEFSASFITGAHASKFGFQMMEGTNVHSYDIPRGITAQYLNGVPRSLTEYATPYQILGTMKPSPSFFAQDQWTRQRLTFNYGLRFDWLNASVPAQQLPPSLYIPYARSYSPVQDVPNWTDLSPRFGVAYDVCGNGRTALKTSIGRYLSSHTLDLADANNPIVTSVISVGRTWTDTDGNYQPDCDLSNVKANGECGAVNNSNFGQNNPNATRYDPVILSGFGVRPNDWEYSVSIQQELMPTLSFSAAYYRHWFGNFNLTSNTAVPADGFDPYCVRAPVDPRLPNGGGYQICGLYDVKPQYFGKISNIVTFSDNFGRQREVYNGVDLTLNVHLPHAAFVQGGVTLGRLEADNCFAANQPQLATQGVGTPRTSAYCDVKPPLAAGTQVKLTGSYLLPLNTRFSGTYQNLAGPQITAAYAIPNSQIAASLGRNLSAGANATVTVDLIPPGTLYENRINQLDLRFARPFTIGSVRVQGLFDIYNALNWASVLGENLTYGPKWLYPTNVGWTSFGFLPGRMLKFGTQIDW